eukprot:m.232824 g.232824  ORF g.232824 m.232824 type:complete len:72 (-) comp18867_c0_seq1:31-246(-)
MPQRLVGGKYTLGQTLGLFMISMGSMFAGASVVHYYYQPNLEIPQGPVQRRERDANAPIISVNVTRGPRQP